MNETENVGFPSGKLDQGRQTLLCAPSCVLKAELCPPNHTLVPSAAQPLA